MFQRGDVVICVRDYWSVTLGKSYIVDYSYNGEHVRILYNDIGDGHSFHVSYFKLDVKTMRKRKIERLFTKGDIVVCIDNDSIHYLTVGKSYIVIDYSKRFTDLGTNTTILNDCGDIHQYYSYRFILLKEYRKRKIERCLQREI